MKLSKFLLIINFFLVLSCGEKNNESNAETLKTTEKPIPVDTNDRSGGEKKDSLRIGNQKDKDRDHLKVIINGEIFYKKNSSDVRVENSYFFRTKDNRMEYDIKTGKYNFNYQLPHGGKEKGKKRSDYDSAEWARKLYYDSINRLPK